MTAVMCFSTKKLIRIDDIRALFRVSHIAIESFGMKMLPRQLINKQSLNNANARIAFIWNSIEKDTRFISIGIKSIYFPFELDAFARYFVC